jgi:L-alanine-DL-glutamate epimerase-like enolase superfamily enzyme
LAADEPLSAWSALAAAAGIPLAAGENMNGVGEFEAAIASRAFAYLQPDVAKWGGVSGCVAVGRAARKAGVTYCPHFLGGGIGLMASAHCLAAVGGPGLLEFDTNPNPLRSEILGAHLAIANGRVRLDEAPGLGFAIEHLERIATRGI